MTVTASKQDRSLKRLQDCSGLSAFHTMSEKYAGFLYGTYQFTEFFAMTDGGG